MDEGEITRRHFLGGLEGGAWGGLILGLHVFLQFGGYITGPLLLWLWGIIMSGVIGGVTGALGAQFSTELGAAVRAAAGAGCALLALVLLWLSSSDNGAVTPPSWERAILGWAEGVALLGVLPGVMAGLRRGTAE